MLGIPCPEGPGWWPRPHSSEGSGIRPLLLLLWISVPVPSLGLPCPPRSAAVPKPLGPCTHGMSISPFRLPSFALRLLTKTLKCPPGSIRAELLEARAAVYQIPDSCGAARGQSEAWTLPSSGPPPPCRARCPLPRRPARPCDAGEAGRFKDGPCAAPAPSQAMDQLACGAIGRRCVQASGPRTPCPALAPSAPGYASLPCGLSSGLLPRPWQALQLPVLPLDPPNGGPHHGLALRLIYKSPRVVSRLRTMS